MAIESAIKVGGISLENDSAELTYLVTGTEDHVAARAHVLSNAPATINSLVLDTVRVEADALDDMWEATATYRQPNFSAPEPESFQISFQASTTQTHIEKAIAQTKYGDNAPDVGKLIGVTHDGVEGVDIQTPTLTVSYRYVKSSAFVTTSYIGELKGVVGTINDAYFKGAAAGEMLCTAVSGSTRDDGNWELDYQFAATENATNIAIGNGITVDEKKGWDYLWVMYETAEDDTAKALIKQPVGAYVAQVYPYTSFSVLGIGT